MDSRQERAGMTSVRVRSVIKTIRILRRLFHSFHNNDRFIVRVLAL